MSVLSDIVAQLESSGGATAGSQPAGMADPTYGQYPGFVSQYGGGAAGVDAYAQAVLAANPNATLGDFYSGYVLGTGSGQTPGTATLGAQQAGALANLLNNAGVPANTPLASLLGPGGASGASTAGTGGSTSVLNPSSWFSAFGNWLGSKAVQAGLVVLAIVFLIGGVLLFAERTQIVAKPGQA